MPQFFSLSSHPGRTGTHFYNLFFEKLGLANHSYRALGRGDLSGAVKEIMSHDDVGGISISMPFKKEIIKFLDNADVLVERYNTCNTVKIVNGKLFGYNADHAGAKHFITRINPSMRVSILGNGAMGSMLKSMLVGYQVTIFSRSLGNWEKRHSATDAIINATAVGTTSNESPLDRVDNCSLVLDLSPKVGRLREQCSLEGKEYVGGMCFYKYQFMEQFKIYTGIDADPVLFDEMEKLL